MTDLQAIEAAIAPVLADRDVVLYDVELTGAGRARVLRVLVDRPGGIDLDAVAEAAEAVSRALDAAPVAQALDGPYSLEVSSPGLERPLRTPAHFARAVGELASITARDDDGATRRVRGTVLGATDDGVEVRLDDGTIRTFRYDDIAKARTVFEWGPAAKGHKREHKREPKREAVRP